MGADTRRGSQGKSRAIDSLSAQLSNLQVGDARRSGKSRGVVMKKRRHVRSSGGVERNVAQRLQMYQREQAMRREDLAHAPVPESKTPFEVDCFTSPKQLVSLQQLLEAERPSFFDAPESAPREPAWEALKMLAASADYRPPSRLVKRRSSAASAPPPAATPAPRMESAASWSCFSNYSAADTESPEGSASPSPRGGGMDPHFLFG
eukprot:TRINITY_DN2235_c0_g1_i2.p1 TRINITY_DN2235_c0_g1~~TRINITY_DN2235_c0_g1_i2.p1  ORF type:complete len:206 (+),score=61.19 TRINITY_DN2235_c0_g1_i2:162-779(+)